ncbi:hypothetical protein JL720_8833 [Aureococcus anophagefferens]|nr:hypothetical protein JL720_8833 [Aureococcus anophagefferens]
MMSTRMTLARLTLAAALCLRAAAFLGAPPAPRGHALRMSSTDTLYGASDARRTEEPAVAADGAEDAADGAEAAASDASAALPDDAAGVDMFGNPEPAETLAAAAAFQEDVAGPAEATYREADFVGSEWKIGVLWRDKEKIDVTWRLFSARVGADGNFVEGVVRGWKPFESATIMGQWQAIRLGVEGRGAAPWFEDEEGE